MISEATFSKKFTSFWNEILPNSKSYVRLINGGYLEAVYEPFDTADRKHNTALINVLSFSLLRSVLNKEQKYSEVCRTKYLQSSHFKGVIEKSLLYLAKFNYGDDCELPLNSKELLQTTQLFKVMYHRYVAAGQITEVDPKFDGCGFVNQSFGDLMSNQTLIEIKSGERRFSVTDVRQVLTYLVLNHYSRRPKRISHVELFNPRMGISFTEGVNSFCLNTSALNSQELFSEIQKFISDNNFVEVYGT